MFLSLFSLVDHLKENLLNFVLFLSTFSDPVEKREVLIKSLIHSFDLQSMTHASNVITY